MKNINLLASVAVFTELYSSNADIYDVIRHFVVEAIGSEKKWSFEPSEIHEILRQKYDLDLPSAVVRKVLKDRLRPDGYVTIDRTGLYHCDIQKFANASEISDDLEEVKEAHRAIIDKLFAYVANQEQRELSDEDKESLSENFHNYLLTGDAQSEVFARHISAFVIKHEEDAEFRSCLNMIKEGLVLYTGIRYSTDLENLGTWRNELTVFLDTEILFSALGYNGPLYEEIFADFYNLVTELNNRSAGKSGKPKIHLRYFEEVSSEIDSYFHAAEMIIRGGQRPGYSKPAMQTILDGSASAGEVVAKKARFFHALEVKGIKPERSRNYYSNPLLNVEDPKTIDALQEALNVVEAPLERDECAKMLRYFTKINVLRDGVNKTPFENARFIFVTGKFATRFCARSQAVREEGEQPFATGLDFVTNQFWFRLGKGVGDGSKLPHSLDVVTKARIIMSAQMAKKVGAHFGQLVDEVKNGVITPEVAEETAYALRSRPTHPEEMTHENIDQAVEFLTHENLERIFEERDRLKERAVAGDQAKLELRQMKAKEWRTKKRAPKRIAKMKWGVVVGASILLGIGYLALAVYLIYAIVTHLTTSIWDALPDLIGLGVFLLPVFSAFKVWRIIRRIGEYFRRRILRTHHQRIDQITP